MGRTPTLQYTDDLIYAWQPGALNEAASDIFGETVDRLNGCGRATRPMRHARNGTCSVLRPPPANVTVNSPAFDRRRQAGGHGGVRPR